MNKSEKQEGSNVSAEPEAPVNDRPIKRDILTLNKSSKTPRKDPSPKHPVTREAPDEEESGKADTSESSESEPPLGDIWEDDGGEEHQAPAVTRKSRRN